MSPTRFRIRELRESKGLSQMALAELVGVRQATISDLETGTAKAARLTLLDALASALGVEPGELLEREGKRRGRAK